MKNRTQTTCDLTVNLSVPSTASEFDELAGEIGACVDKANDMIVMHSWLGRFRPALADAIEKTLKFVRKGERDAEGNVTNQEKEQAFIKRAIHELGIDTLQELADTVAEKIPFEVKPTSKRISKKFLDAAVEVIEQWNITYAGDFNEAIKKITALNPNVIIDFDGDGVPTEESVAYALKVNTERVERESQNSVL